jgi:type VI secretion system protein ImpC
MAEPTGQAAAGKQVVTQDVSILDQIIQKTPATQRSGLESLIDGIVKNVTPEDVVSKNAADRVIARLEERMQDQITAILHNDKFQALEAAWKGLDQMVQRTDFLAADRVIVEIVNVSKERLLTDFQENPSDMIRTGLYEKVYTQAYDRPGANPYGIMIGNYEFENTAEDIQLLSDIGNVARAAHCPFIGSISAKFFKFDSLEAFTRKHFDDLRNILDGPEFIAFKNFRKTESSRYIGLTIPRFLLRHPYGENNRVRSFANFVEKIDSEKEHEKFLWGNTAFAFGAVASQSFTKFGWMDNVCGRRSGGKFESLPIHTYEVGGRSLYKVPTEAWITESNEKNWSDLGFIPMVSYENQDFAVFFSSQSLRQPDEELIRAQDRANEQLGANLANIMLVSRFVHYLKAILRDNLGAKTSPGRMKSELDEWVRQYWVDMDDPSPVVMAKKPIRKYKLDIKEKEDQPGFFYIDFEMTPHSRFVGADVTISLVADVPNVEAPK